MQFANVEFEMCRTDRLGDGSGRSECDWTAILGRLVSCSEECVCQRTRRQFLWQVKDVPQLDADPIPSQFVEREFTGQRHQARYRRRICPAAERHDESLGPTFAEVVKQSECLGPCKFLFLQ